MDDFERELVELLPRLDRLARSLARSHADAADLAQQTVERALAKRRQWRAGTRLDSWVFTIMKRLFIDQHRSARRWTKVLSPEDDFTAHVGDAGVASEDLRADALAMRQAIRDLPEDQRLAVALVLIDGLAYAEAATVLEVPVGTLTSRLVRGRQTLIDRMTREGVTP